MKRTTRKYFMLLLAPILCVGCSSSDNEDELLVSLTVNPTELVFESENESQDVAVESNVEWSAFLKSKEAQEWISLHPNKDKLTIEVKENTSSKERISFVTLEAQSKTAEIKVVQKGAEEIIKEKAIAYKLVMPNQKLFDKSKILNLQGENNELLGVLCLEYLKSAKVADQRITLYPTLNEEINYLKGILLPDGGSLAWEDGNYTFTYRPAEVEVKALYLTTQGELFFNPPEDALIKEIGITPRLLEDKRQDEVNKYALVKIGKQIWMAENLNTIYYQDGSPIESYVDKDQWENTDLGTYATYANDAANRDKYALLYNWAAVSNEKQLAPKGFQITTDKDWVKMAYYLDPDNYGVDEIHGGARESETVAPLLKSTTGWLDNDEAQKSGNGNNLSGLNVKPCGGTSTSAYIDFQGLERRAYFWTTTEYGDGAAMFRRIYHDEDFLNRWYQSTTQGYSVRCVINLN